MVRAERLMATRPPYTGAVLCHGDMHPINILRGPGGEAVIDWTYATYDDPLYDVAVTRMILWHFPVKSPWVLRLPIRRAGRSMARRFVARYESGSNATIDPQRLAWFSRLAALRILTGVEDWRSGRDFGRPADHPFYLLATRLEQESG
jgi:aminoglycoside phosphotransferase (APT) family kinase protein